MIVHKRPPPQVLPLASFSWNHGFSGNAFVIDPRRGLLATAYHCVENLSGRHGLGFRHNGTWMSASVYAVDPQADIAIIKSEEMIFPEMPDLYWADDLIQEGEPVYIYGWMSCAGPKAYKSRCMRANYQREYDRRSIGVARKGNDGTIPGMSGSPALDRHQRLVGIFVAYSKNVFHLAPISNLAKLL